MSSTTIGLVHPGEMGAALGAALRAVGHDVTWASAGRSDATSERAREADLRDVESVGELANEAALIVSVCPPHAALEVARLFSGFEGAYVDANAISPETTRRVGAALSRYVDGGVIGPATPTRHDTLVSLGCRRPRSGGAFHRHGRRCVCVVGGDRRRVRVEDGVRGVDEGNGGASPRTSSGRASRRRRRRTPSGMERVPARPRGAFGECRAIRGEEGLALGRRDGRDRRDIRGRRPAARIPSSRSRGLPRISVETVRAASRRPSDLSAKWRAVTSSRTYPRSWPARPSRSEFASASAAQASSRGPRGRRSCSRR